VRPRAAALVAALLLATGAAPAADPVRGKEIYDRCIACHALGYDRVGPRHCGLFGRRAGSVPGFAYSAAMTRSEIVWGKQSLDRFLADPTGTVPGTTMGYAGIPSPEDRADLIAYLGVVNESARECPPRAPGTPTTSTVRRDQSR